MGVVMHHDIINAPKILQHSLKVGKVGQGGQVGE